MSRTLPARLRTLAAPMALGALAALLTLGGCGWHQGYLAPPGAEEARTIGIQPFGNDSPEPGLEADLAPHLSEAVVDWVDLELVRPGRADLLVRGKVLDLRRQGGVRSEDNELLESITRIEVAAELVRTSDDTVLATATGGLWGDWAIGGAALSGPGQGEDQARERVLANLADRLVLDLFAKATDVEEAPAARP
mgnify:CR=1 FL=1